MNEFNINNISNYPPGFRRTYIHIHIQIYVCLYMRNFAIYKTTEDAEKEEINKVRGRERRSARQTPIAVQELARQAHYQEKMFRDCALERDVFGSLVRSLRSSTFVFPSSPSSPYPLIPRAVLFPCLPPCHLIISRELSSSSPSLSSSRLSFNRNVISVTRRKRQRISAYVRFVNQDCFQRV